MSGIFDTETIEQFRRHISTARNIVLMAHSNPDGDAIGSMLALRDILVRVLNKPTEAVHCLLPNRCPRTMMFLPGAESLQDAETDLENCLRQVAESDLIICLDLNKAERVGPLQEALRHSTAHKLLLDHHRDPDETLFDAIISQPTISSTCELLYWVSLQTWGDVLDTATATCLYTGMCTDTGSFSYSCEQPSLYEAAAALLQHPIGAAEIHNRLFNTYSVERMNFLGFCLSQRLRIFPDHHLAYFYLSHADQRQYHVQPEELEGIVNYTLMMETIEVGALVKEGSDGCVRISLRSKYDFDVNQFAMQLYGGGGHRKAAGATSSDDFNTTVSRLEQNLLAALSTKPAER